MKTSFLFCSFKSLGMFSMVWPTLVMGSTCSIRKQKIDCRFSIQMCGILEMFIDKRYLNVQTCMLTLLLFFSSAMMSRLLCFKITSWNQGNVWVTSKHRLFTLILKICVFWLNSPALHVYNMPKMSTSLHLKSPVRGKGRDLSDKWYETRL